MSLTAYLYKVSQLKANGAPIDSLALEPSVAWVNGIGVSAHSSHPHAAVLFFDWLLSDGQQILAQREFFPTNKKYLRLPEGLNLTFVDPARQIDENAKWQKLFDDIILKQAR